MKMATSIKKITFHFPRKSVEETQEIIRETQKTIAAASRSAVGLENAKSMFHLSVYRAGRALVDLHTLGGWNERGIPPKGMPKWTELREQYFPSVTGRHMQRYQAIASNWKDEAAFAAWYESETVRLGKRAATYPELGFSALPTMTQLEKGPTAPASKKKVSKARPVGTPTVPPTQAQMLERTVESLDAQVQKAAKTAARAIVDASGVEGAKEKVSLETQEIDHYVGVVQASGLRLLELAIDKKSTHARDALVQLAGEFSNWVRDASAIVEKPSVTVTPIGDRSKVVRPARKRVLRAK
jgi:hypothetical protein